MDERASDLRNHFEVRERYGDFFANFLTRIRSLLLSVDCYVRLWDYHPVSASS